MTVLLSGLMKLIAAVMVMTVRWRMMIAQRCQMLQNMMTMMMMMVVVMMMVQVKILAVEKQKDQQMIKIHPVHLMQVITDLAL